VCGRKAVADKYEEICQPAACAAQFGQIQAALKRTETDRKEIKAEIESLRKEIHTVTGNGNKGRIDELHERVVALAAEYRESKVHGFAFHDKQDERMDAMEEKIDCQNQAIHKITGKIAVLSLKIGIPFMIAIALFQWWIIKTATAGGLGPNELELLREILEKASSVS
jgi:tetrahydromethanopterin S-methyltransferase subunit G